MLVHRKHLPDWNRVAERCGQSNARELWKHLTSQPDQAPELGTVTPMKGGHNKAKGGMSRVYHYEVTGAARVDYRYNPKYTTDSADADEHKVVQIISIDLGSH